MKRIAIALLSTCLTAGAQVAVSPILQPHQFYANSNIGGAPCAGCSLYSYAAGTTNPQPTYTDSTGNTQNTNPVVLDASGDATIWTAIGSSYKFVLQDALGNTLWTVDNVPGSQAGALGNTINILHPPAGSGLSPAACTGSANDSTPVQAIVNYAGANTATTGALTVLIPCHTKLNITVPTGVTIQCLNGNSLPVSSGPYYPQSLLIDGSSGASPIVTMTGGASAIRNCGFQGTGSGASDIGILVNSTAANVVIDGNSFNGFGLSGISMPYQQSNGSWVTNNKGQSLLLNARGGTWIAPVGALDLEGNDTKVFNNEFTASTNATIYSVSPEAYACVSGGKAQFWRDNVCEESEGGLYVKEYAGAGSRFVANRADLNGGWGFNINDGCGTSGGGGSGAFGGDAFIGNWALNDSRAGANTYDGFLVNCNTNNIVTGNTAYNDQSFPMLRYGFNDTSSETHSSQFLQFNRWDSSNTCLNQVGGQNYTACYSSTTTVDNLWMPFGQNKAYLGNMFTDGSTFNPMQFGILGSYTDNSNWSALQLGTFDGSNYFIQPSYAGTGTHGGLVFGNNSTASFKIDTSAITTFLTQQKLYSAAGCTTAANGQLCFDTTNLNWHGWIGADFLVGMLNPSGLTSGHIPILHQSTNTWSLQDSGLSPPVWGLNTMVSGTKVVSTSAACTPGNSCVYKLTNCGINASTGIGTLGIGSVSVGTSFTVNSLSPTGTVLTTDVSSFCWQIN